MRKWIKEHFEDIKGVIRSHQLKKYRQCNGWKKNEKGQTTIYKSLHRKLRIEQHEHNKKKLRYPGRISTSCSTCSTHRVTAKRHEHHFIWKSCWKLVYVNQFGLILVFVLQHHPIMDFLYLLNTVLWLVVFQVWLQRYY
jgi:hypothetical protein